MSKLDEILIQAFEAPHRNGVVDTSLTTGGDGKQQIKALLLELVGEPDETYHGNNDGYGWRNDLRKEIREKITSL